jgi:hypothetical protein
MAEADSVAMNTREEPPDALLDRMIAPGGWVEPKVRYRAFPPPLKHTLGTLHRAINPVDLLPHQS